MKRLREPRHVAERLHQYCHSPCKEKTCLPCYQQLPGARGPNKKTELLAGEVGKGSRPYLEKSASITCKMQDSIVSLKYARRDI